MFMKHASMLLRCFLEHKPANAEEKVVITYGIQMVQMAVLCTDQRHKTSVLEKASNALTDYERVPIHCLMIFFQHVKDWGLRGTIRPT